MTFRRYAAATVSSLALLWAAAAVAEPVRTDHAEAELHARDLHAVPGETLWVALRLRPDMGWHTYWRNPGDSGLPTRINWMLPEGVSAGDIQWPMPDTYSLADIVNYGYGEETLHLVPISVPDHWPVGETLHLSAFAEWLICEDICVPEAADLSLSVAVAEGAAPEDPIWASHFARARSRLPSAVDWPTRLAVDEATLRISVSADELPDDTVFTFFPHADDLLNHSAPASVQRAGNRLWLAQPRSDFFSSAPERSSWTLVMELPNGERRAVDLTAELGEVDPVQPDASNAGRASVETPPATTEPAGRGFSIPIPLALLFAFLGGLILNLMPCVFPVLAIKALGVVKARGEEVSRQRQHALAYTAGVVLSCLAAAAALLALRAGGQALGWGFQLQSPVFIGVLAYVFLALGLSLSGVTMFGTRLMGVGQNLAGGKGAGSSFMTGVLAVVVASPCTAPFMGTALGFAIVQPTLTALTIFAALGLGLAFPFLLVGFVPAVARLLPKPGAWMETFKEALAFPLYLSVAWLLWVLTRQAGAEALFAVLVGLVLIGMALWLQRYTGLFARGLRYAVILAALALLFSPTVRDGQPPSAGVVEGEARWEAWSPERVAELRSEGRTIFVNFTADWCITCLANERTTLASSSVVRAFAEQDVVYLKADWTRIDPTITEALASFGRNGVPLYLLYLDGGEPKVLPQVLTPDIVVSRLHAS
jgi:thiol:disulfide interchange protein